jgi:hypothetical protein
VFDADASVALGIVLIGPLRMSGSEILQLAGELTASARAISRQLDGRPPGGAGSRRPADLPRG